MKAVRGSQQDRGDIESLMKDIQKAGILVRLPDEKLEGWQKKLQAKLDDASIPKPKRLKRSVGYERGVEFGITYAMCLRLRDWALLRKNGPEFDFSFNRLFTVGRTLGSVTVTLETRGASDFFRGVADALAKPSTTDARPGVPIAPTTSYSVYRLL